MADEFEADWVVELDRVGTNITPSRKIKSNSIQFCIEYLVLFDFICFQLSCFYGLSLLVLSIRYHDDVITLT